MGQVGSWRLTRLVSEGRLCRVYQAAPAGNASLKTAAYALKLLSPQWHDDVASVACIEREALLGREVSHAHLVPVLAAHTVASPYYLVMPWISGATLRAHLTSQDSIAPAAAFWIARQVAEALAGACMRPDGCTAM